MRINVNANTKTKVQQRNANITKQNIIQTREKQTHMHGNNKQTNQTVVQHHTRRHPTNTFLRI